jgi:transcriptional regulator GlxA family with amidase domain
MISERSSVEGGSMSAPIPLLLLAPPVASGSSLFGLYDTLTAAGRDWETLVTGAQIEPLFDVRLVGTGAPPRSASEGYLVAPDTTIYDAPEAKIIVVPGLNLSPRSRLVQSDHPAIDWLRQMLETTDQPVAEIAEEVGYRDVASFRRLFKRKTGISPTGHRRMFGVNRFARYG